MVKQIQSSDKENYDLLLLLPNVYAMTLLIITNTLLIILSYSVLLNNDVLLTLTTIRNIPISIAPTMAIESTIVSSTSLITTSP
ncbi:hypothetical protein [Deltalipothrixvirus pozzuoliense]|uniref:Uncharacterized protein ORF83 n=1 Tax=Acidianus filamentous virus 2 (isolate Italy/Pozzuoli) TaxID=654910 RepID=Y083_AFV2P|nr:hypothetical protein AFV2_gp18 [Acidianus filamentous virus 2]Q573F1.1 RecName: Full=Uncharacterized protein ORF83 [Acidianus filamentous virus 2 (isolate Pozzuoli)]CAH69405.1 hypothetical protein [Acidianus filamentous virus 2]